MFSAQYLRFCHHWKTSELRQKLILFSLGCVVCFSPIRKIVIALFFIIPTKLAMKMFDNSQVILTDHTHARKRRIIYSTLSILLPSFSCSCYICQNDLRIVSHFEVRFVGVIKNSSLHGFDNFQVILTVLYK